MAPSKSKSSTKKMKSKSQKKVMINESNVENVLSIADREVPREHIEAGHIGKSRKALDSVGIGLLRVAKGWGS